MLEWNLFCFHCMLNSHASVYVITSMNFILYYVHRDSFLKLDSKIVASSLPGWGVGTWQCGIRAHVAAWAWMDHKGAVTEEGFLSAQQRSEVDDRKIPQICLSVWTAGSSEHLVGRTSDVAEELDGSMPNGGQFERKLWEKFSKCSASVDRK